MTEPSFAAVDFEEVLNRLVLYAQSLSAAMMCAGLQERILPGGESAEDLAMATLLKFVDPLNTSVKWSEQKAEPTTATVLAYLRKVLERDFLDLKKSKRYRTTVYVDAYGDDEDEAGITLEQLAKTFETPEGEAQRRQQVEWVLQQFDLELELKEIVGLQLDHNGYNAFSNQELGRLLSTTVADIEKRKKRIKLRLRKLAASRGTKEAEHV
jgi:DNA-directed RNA polymerase specialized sigma24 family protein